MKRWILICSLFFCSLLLTFGLAQDYPWQPDRPITIIVPWAAGGSTDQVTRIVASELEDALGQSVVVVNQPGASGSIGTKNALEAPLDGYTWTAGAAGDLGTYVVLDMLDTSLADWHLYLDVANASVIGVNPNTPYQTFDELLEAMQANPGEISVATAGLSSAGHNAMELIAQATGAEYNHVTYDGGNPAVIATVSGRDGRDHAARRRAGRDDPGGADSPARGTQRPAPDHRRLRRDSAHHELAPRLRLVDELFWHLGPDRRP